MLAAAQNGHVGHQHGVVGQLSRKPHINEHARLQGTVGIVQHDAGGCGAGEIFDLRQNLLDRAVNRPILAISHTDASRLSVVNVGQVFFVDLRVHPDG